MRDVVVLAPSYAAYREYCRQQSLPENLHKWVAIKYSPFIGYQFIGTQFIWWEEYKVRGRTFNNDVMIVELDGHNQNVEQIKQTVEMHRRRE